MQITNQYLAFSNILHRQTYIFLESEAAVKRLQLNKLVEKVKTIRIFIIITYFLCLSRVLSPLVAPSSPPVDPEEPKSQAL